ncbi:MAG: biotin--[acetyl-CoA-carboxylase] ligase [Alphaproteobacteria bacterium]|nr:biotin--[acetyl-CoA-carboxylase] ligase [Alphaproteobacteria bacterium]
MIDSTNAQALRVWRAPGGWGTRPLAITADEQTAGVGRGGRTWRSPRGGLWLTVAWPVGRRPGHYQALPLAVGLAVAQAVEAVAGLAATIKWPNDLLIGDRKVCGILCRYEAAEPPVVLAGIGLNANVAAASLGGDLPQPATSLRRSVPAAGRGPGALRCGRPGAAAPGDPQAPGVGRSRRAVRAARLTGAVGHAARHRRRRPARARYALRADRACRGRTGPSACGPVRSPASSHDRIDGVCAMTMMTTTFPMLGAEEAAKLIPHGATVGFSGFTPAGSAKAVPAALAARARAMHEQNRPFQIRALTGASTGHDLDQALAEADAISWRSPYQSSRALRQRINEQQCQFVDMHLSHVPQTVAFGFFGKINYAVVEAVDVTPDGRIYLSTSIGGSPTFLKHAQKIIVEVNRHHSMRLPEMHDVFILPPPPDRRPIPIYDPLTKIGQPYVRVDPDKIVAVVENDADDGVSAFTPADDASRRIARHVVRFLLDEMRADRIPVEFLPLQSGVGNVANAVMEGLGADPDIPPFYMYSEVYQDSLVRLMEDGKLLGASATSLTVTDDNLKRIYDNFDFFGPRIVLRPQELSNNPGVIRRLGAISMNTALELDIYGHVNSTHVAGVNMMNGIGGSGDFTRNAYLSLFMCPSIAKGGRISTIVPMCSHVDHNEHSVQAVVTEQGLADLRGLGPMQRARAIIDHCAHPVYRDYLHGYLEHATVGHIRHDLSRCFEMHTNLIEHGAMLPDLDLSSVGG